MPKRFYNARKRRDELERNKRTRTSLGPVGDYKLLVRYGDRGRKRGEPTSFPVFEFLNEALRKKPVGVKATYRQTRQDGRRVDYVYEKGENGYFLLERHHYPSKGGEPRIEMVPVQNNWKPAKPFSDERVRRLIEKGKHGLKGHVSLHGKHLTRRQRQMLIKAGWEFSKAKTAGTWPGAWINPGKG